MYPRSSRRSSALAQRDFRGSECRSACTDDGPFVGTMGDRPGGATVEDKHVDGIDEKFDAPHAQEFAAAVMHGKWASERRPEWLRRTARCQQPAEENLGRAHHGPPPNGPRMSRGRLARR